MLLRYLLYGLAGWSTEVLFTGAASALRRDRSATAQTYLWMHPIYGGAGLLLESLSRRVAHWPRLLRPLPYVGVIYATEYSTGWILRKGLGRCPWDYTGSGLHVHGLIRLDYLPAWYGLALAFEAVRDAVALAEHAWREQRLQAGAGTPLHARSEAFSGAFASAGLTGPGHLEARPEPAGS